MSELRDTARWLAGQLAATQDALGALSAPQLGSSSIEAGSVEEYDQDGTLVSAVGAQFDGTHAAVTLAGPVPPEPSAPTITPGAGSVTVRWDGLFAGGILSPMDFHHVAVHASRQDIFEPDNTTQLATITGESGDTATILLDVGVWTFVLVAVSLAGKWSLPSDPTTSEVVDVMAPTDVQDMLLGLDTSLTAVQTSVNGKNTITNATTDAAPATPGTTAGDRWQKWSTLDVGGKLLASWRWSGTVWIPEVMDPTYLPLVDIGAGTFGTLDGQRLKAQSVTASLLEALLVLASDVVAGNPNGTHARMTPTGFRVMAAGADGGTPTEVIRMGTNTDDYFGVSNATGQLVASISSTGDMTATSLDVDKDVTIAGTSVLDTIDARAGNLLAWASRATNGLYYAGTSEHPYLSLQVDGIRAGRAYMISTSPIHMTSDTANSDGVVRMHYVGGVDRPATISDPIIDQGYSVPTGWSTGRRAPVTFNRLITPSTDGSVSILLAYCVESSGRAKILSDGLRPVFMTVQDMGWAMNQTGEVRNGTSDAPSGGSGGGETTAPTTSVKNYDQTWSATGLRSFTGSGATYAYNTGYMYSGLSPSGYGDLSSMAVFPSLTTTLSGATITGVWVYVYYDFWYNGSGGDAYIGLHGQTGLTSTAPAKTYSFALSSAWPRAAGRWIKMSSSTWDGFRTGLHRGFTLGGSGGGYERYGYAHAPKLRITYTK